MIELPMASVRCCGSADGSATYGETNLGSTQAWCPDCRAVEHALYSATGLRLRRLPLLSDGI